ncbi:hypothetical protein QTP86_005049 [Hemibagrus guttatus]|nr:hypothetical protein QTP86_005049 [Hemibagrus guttatus]
MLQTISPDLLPFITTVINGSLTSGHVPTVFKKARVIPILKKPALDPSDISNYRLVSLLSFLSKILEHVVCNQLSEYLMQNNLHDPNQSGFKAAHSTETALLAVTEKLHAARSAKLSSVLILLDLSAAFDTINHKTLLSTLRSLGICGTAWEWFASYLDGHSYQVTWKGLTSAPRRLSTGVPQDSVFGPLLFSLYTHSLGKVISSHGFSYHCYADDTQLIFSFPPSDTTASARISACLADISSWMTAHQLKLNPSKTELLVIPGDPSPAQDLAISLNNSMISPSATARNLGLTMDNQLSFSSHVTNVARSCRFLLYNIRRIRPFLSTQATQVLVQSLVISRLDYCNFLLAGLPLNAIRPLQMIQNAAAQLVFNLPKFSHTTPLLRSLHWLPVAARIRFKTLMLAYKAKNGPAPSYLKALVTPRTACLADISSWMTAHQLKLNPSKTELLVIPGDPSPAQDLAISLNNSMISPSATARNLGLTMDNQLSFSSHVTNVARSCRFLLYNIRRIRPFLSTQATQVLVQSLVISRLDYCNFLLAGLPLNAIRPLQMIQNAAAQLVFNLPKFSHTTPLLRSLHWLPVAARIRFKTLMLAYKAKNGPAPSYLKALVTPRTAPRSLRSTSTARLVPPSLREKGRSTTESTSQWNTCRKDF